MDCPSKMDALASEQMIQSLMSRLYQSGHFLTPSQVERVHMMLDDSEQSNNIDGRSQTEAAKAIQQRIDRDQ